MAFGQSFYLAGGKSQDPGHHLLNIRSSPSLGTFRSSIAAKYQPHLISGGIAIRYYRVRSRSQGSSRDVTAIEVATSQLLAYQTSVDGSMVRVHMLRASMN